MQIVIDIPEDLYEECTRLGDSSDILFEAIRKGKILPKEHGRLIDPDAVNERFYSIYSDAVNCSNQPSDKYLLDKLSMCLDTALTIIEADTESEG